MDIDSILFRSSAVGNLMGKQGIGLTGEKLLIETYIEHKYGRSKDIVSKYLDKGTQCEQQGIDLLNKISGENYVKNEIRIANEYITGECDINADEIIDIKSSWDIYTHFAAKRGLNSIYEWQLRCYMELYKKEHAKLVYTLTNASEIQVLTTLEKEAYKHPLGTPEWKEIEIVKNMVYDQEGFDKYKMFRQWQGDDETSDGLLRTFIHIPEEDRIFSYDFTHDKAKIQSLYERIILGRDFLKQQFNG